MTVDEVKLFNLIDQQTAQHGYGVCKIRQSADGSFYRIELSSSDGKRDKSLIVFREAAEQTIRENRLTFGIQQNIASELGGENSGTR